VVLNALLLERAEAVGCRVVRSRMSQLDTAEEHAKLGIGSLAWKLTLISSLRGGKESASRHV
jgi:hypothetical protein